MRAATRLSAAVALLTALAGCILFPFPPFGMPPERDLLVENQTDDEWVLGISGMFSQEFAIPASAVGQVHYTGSPGEEVELVLRTRECEAVATLAPAPDTSAVRIGDGTLSEVSDGAGAAETEPQVFAPIFDCSDRVSVASPEPGAGALDLPHSRMLVVSGMASSVATLDLPELALGDLLAGSDPVMEAALAPVGDAFAYVRFDPLAPDGQALHVRDASGRERLLRENAATPAWSPDGTLIAYIDTDPFSGGPALRVIGADGSDDRLIAERGGAATWSPGGDLLAYVNGTMPADFSPFAEPPAAELLVVGLDGGEPHRLADAAPWSPPPAWSPDGAQLAFVAPSNGFDGEVHVVGVADGEARPLLADGASGGEPAWSPDGQRIAMSRANLGGATIVVVDVQSGEETALTEGTESFDANPVWSPDGRWVAFVRDGFDGSRSGLWVVPADGGEARLLATGVLRVLGWAEPPR